MTDLKARLTSFSKDVILFCQSLESDAVTRPLVSQVVRSATSIGANYAESQSGISRKDFRAKIYICKKEAEETKYWLDLLKVSFPKRAADLDSLLGENQQIVKILQAITNKLST
jgi:four helix bundle protein